jgi:hypothetical protein
LENNICFESDWCCSKKEADKNVAQKAYEYVTGKKQEKCKELCIKKSVFIENKTVVLIDLENYPHMNTPNFLNTKFENVVFLGFVGKCSSYVHKNLKELYPFIKIIIVNSAHKDAVDHFISMFTGMILDKYTNFLILTKDRFAGSAVDAAKQLNPTITIMHVVKADDCYKELLNLTQ